MMVSVFVGASVDGFIARPNGALRRSRAWSSDPKKWVASGAEACSL